MTTKLSHSSSHCSVRCQQRGIYSCVYNLLGTPSILLTHCLGTKISEGERVPLLLVLSLLLDHILLYSPLSLVLFPIPPSFPNQFPYFPFLIFSVDYRLDHDPGLKGFGPFIKQLYECRDGSDHHLLYILLPLAELHNIPNWAC